MKLQISILDDNGDFRNGVTMLLNDADMKLPLNDFWYRLLAPSMSYLFNAHALKAAPQSEGVIQSTTAVESPAVPVQTQSSTRAHVRDPRW